jgi:GNAT superfamily N-acetyltransferase
MDELVTTLPTDPRAQPLIDDLGRDYDERYGLNDGVPSSFELQRYPAELFSPENGGAFLLLLRDGVVAAGGAYKRVSDDIAEIKRVWTNPDFRRQGLARVIMAALESAALDAGYSVAELTTGARQPEALALYLSLGYEPLFDLEGDYEEISYLEFRKRLPARAHRSARSAA